MEKITALVEELKADVIALPKRTNAAVRSVRQAYTKRIKDWESSDVFNLALEIIKLGEAYRWIAYELVHYHRVTIESLGKDELEALGAGIHTWQQVDVFAPYLSGVAWRKNQIDDAVIHEWARSEDFWWRRVALVSTIGLNVKARGGIGDVDRTLSVCELLIDDREDMVVKALSWSLRCLVVHDAAAVRAFVHKHDDALAARVRREVRNKLETGLKNP
jgi:3-methyladenine DNA glycosylase AlkD